MIQHLKNKAAIYIIINKISRNYYIGSANINKIYTTFSRHMINLNGNKIVKKAILKNGLNNFIFAILEYYPNTGSSNINNNINNLSNTCSRNLYELETMYLIALLPKYNILREANTSASSIDIDENIQKLKLSFDKERHSLLNKLNTSSLIKTEIIENKLSTISSSYIKLYDLNNNYICKFKNANTASHYLCCSYKIIERSLDIG
jgi:group I intron endonuclease